MKRFVFLAVMALAAVAQAAPVYECVDARGNRTYGERSGSNCKAADLKGVGFSSAPAYKGAQTSVGEAGTAAVPVAEGGMDKGTQERAAQLAQARRAVQAAKRNLEEGRKVRYGNERNYVRYQERIAGLASRRR